jgi:membrane protease YdiL (CAAX protease family)
MSNDSSDQTIPKQTEKQGAWIGPFSIVYVIFCFFASQVIAGIALYAYGGSRGWKQATIEGWLNDSVPAQFWYFLLSDGLIFLSVLFGLKILGWSWRTIGLTKPKFRHILMGVVATLPYYVLYIAIVAVLTQLIPALNVDQKQEIGFDNVTGHTQLLLTFVSLVVLPPLAEEITMRGYLYTGVRRWLPKIWAALLVSALFGSAHLAEGGAAGPLWIGAIDTFTLSMVLVYLREKTGNLWAGITLHACKNGIAFWLLFGR